MIIVNWISYITMMVDESSDLQRRFYNLVRDCLLGKRNNNNNNKDINTKQSITLILIRILLNKRKTKDNIQ